ncbi:hypothetical protein HBB16_00095 [Pseudonocardia sp. MCCB 268]|nr:hypothetical protein [Pseudonocardia cytotoxica]
MAAASRSSRPVRSPRPAEVTRARRPRRAGPAPGGLRRHRPRGRRVLRRGRCTRAAASPGPAVIEETHHDHYGAAGNRARSSSPPATT